MSETNIKITDNQLKERLTASSLTAELKKKLEDTIPSMNEEQRNQLIEILNQDDTEKAVFEEEKMEQLVEVNKKFETESKELEKTESKNVRVEFEKLDKEESEKELGSVEEEIEKDAVNREDAIKTQTQTAVPNDQPKTKQKHTKRNFILIVITLIALIAIIIGVLTSM